MQQAVFNNSYYVGTIMSKKGTSQYKAENKTLIKEGKSGLWEQIINVDQL